MMEDFGSAAYNSDTPEQSPAAQFRGLLEEYLEFIGHLRAESAEHGANKEALNLHEKGINSHLVEYMGRICVDPESADSSTDTILAIGFRAYITDDYKLTGDILTGYAGDIEGSIVWALKDWKDRLGVLADCAKVQVDSEEVRMAQLNFTGEH